MFPPTTQPSPPANPGAFRSVPTCNIVRILSGELPMPSEKSRDGRSARARAVPSAGYRFNWWQRVLHALGLFG